MTATPRDLELGSGFLGNEPGRPLRALGAILGDLADLRRTARWIGLPTSLTGAPHHRFSIFTIAYRRGAVPDAASNRLLSGRRDDGDGQGPPRHYRTEPSDSRPRIQRTGGSTINSNAAETLFVLVDSIFVAGGRAIRRCHRSMGAHHRTRRPCPRIYERGERATPVAGVRGMAYGSASEMDYRHDGRTDCKSAEDRLG